MKSATRRSRSEESCCVEANSTLLFTRLWCVARVVDFVSDDPRQAFRLRAVSFRFREAIDDGWSRAPFAPLAALIMDDDTVIDRTPFKCLLTAHNGLDTTAVLRMLAKHHFIDINKSFKLHEISLQSTFLAAAVCARNVPVVRCLVAELGANPYFTASPIRLWNEFEYEYTSRSLLGYVVDHYCNWILDDNVFYCTELTGHTCPYMIVDDKPQLARELFAMLELLVNELGVEDRPDGNGVTALMRAIASRHPTEFSAKFAPHRGAKKMTATARERIVYERKQLPPSQRVSDLEIVQMLLRAAKRHADDEMQPPPSFLHDYLVEQRACTELLFETHVLELSRTVSRRRNNNNAPSDATPRTHNADTCDNAASLATRRCIVAQRYGREEDEDEDFSFCPVERRTALAILAAVIDAERDARRRLVASPQDVKQVETTTGSANKKRKQQPQTQREPVAQQPAQQQASSSSVVVVMQGPNINNNVVGNNNHTVVVVQQQTRRRPQQSQQQQPRRMWYLSPCHLAACNGDAKTLELLLDAGFVVGGGPLPSEEARAGLLRAEALLTSSMIESGVFEISYGFMSSLARGDCAIVEVLNKHGLHCVEVIKQERAEELENYFWLACNVLCYVSCHRKSLPINHGRKAHFDKMQFLRTVDDDQPHHQHPPLQFAVRGIAFLIFILLAVGPFPLYRAELPAALSSSSSSSSGRTIDMTLSMRLCTEILAPSMEIGLRPPEVVLRMCSRRIPPSRLVNATPDNRHDGDEGEDNDHQPYVQKVLRHFSSIVSLHDVAFALHRKSKEETEFRWQQLLVDPDYASAALRILEATTWLRLVPSVMFLSPSQIRPGVVMIYLLLDHSVLYTSFHVLALVCFIEYVFALGTRIRDRCLVVLPPTTNTGLTQRQGDDVNAVLTVTWQILRREFLLLFLQLLVPPLMSTAVVLGLVFYL